uniref:ABC-2 type transporter transmembrane domain-containing protein n=1 Tax=Oryza brachyantha TaxID=4533 RepID=J3MQP3_ORYBR
MLHAGIAPQIGAGDGEVGGGAAANGGGSEAELKEVRGKLAAAYERHIAPAVKLDICAREGGGVGQGGAAAAAARRRGKAAAEWTTGWWTQFTVLLRRGMKERRYESFNKLRIFQVLSVASLAGLLWWRTPAAHLQDRTALIFFFSVFWGFFPLYNAVFTFPLERPMLLKERSSGMYRLSSYFAARTAADLPMELALPTAFVVILYWMGGLDPRPGAFLLSLLVVLYSVLVAQSLGLAIGAVLMDVKQGTTLASVITMAVGLNNHWVDVCVMALLLVGYRVIAYIALDRLKPR